MSSHHVQGSASPPCHRRSAYTFARSMGACFLMGHGALCVVREWAVNRRCCCCSVEHDDSADLFGSELPRVGEGSPVYCRIYGQNGRAARGPGDRNNDPLFLAVDHERRVCLPSHLHVHRATLLTPRTGSRLSANCNTAAQQGKVGRPC
jgi:hypothetical protein